MKRKSLKIKSFFIFLICVLSLFGCGSEDTYVTKESRLAEESYIASESVSPEDSSSATETFSPEDPSSASISVSSEDPSVASETASPEDPSDTEKTSSEETSDSTKTSPEETSAASKTSSEETSDSTKTSPEDSSAPALHSSPEEISGKVRFNIDIVPPYSGVPYTVIYNNLPSFDESDFSAESFEYYPALDRLGRCKTCVSNIGYDLMPTKARGEIGSIKPSGWHTVKYAGIVEGNYLYNRCHLIGFQLTGENANPKNLITGTRYMNTEGMLPFENMVADYVKETHNHVLYRVNPVFEGDNLVATGVQIEARSYEDNGDGICFNVFCYNVQPKITVNYLTGESSLMKEAATETTAPETKAPETDSPEKTEIYVWIPKTGEKYHSRANCSNMKDPSKVTENYAISHGYTKCKRCY